MADKQMIPLFITADISQKTLDEFINSSKTQNTEEGEIAFAIINELSRESLKPVKSKATLPSDLSHSKGLKPLECLELFRKHFNARDEEGGRGNYSTFVCVILDEQSEKDKTGILLEDTYSGPKSKEEKERMQAEMREEAEELGVEYESEDEETIQKTYGKPPTTEANTIAEDVNARRLPFKSMLEMAMNIEAGSGYLTDDIEVQE